MAANTTKYRERPMEKTNDGSDFAIFSEILNPSHAIPAAKSPATRMYIGAFNPTFAKVYKPIAGIGLYTLAKVGLNAPIYILVAGLFAAGIAWLGFRISEKMAKSLPSFVFSMGLSLYLVVLAATGSSFFGRDGMRFL